MTTSTIQLPANFVEYSLNNATNLLASFGGYITLIVGVLLAVIVIEILIGALKK